MDEVRNDSFLKKEKKGKRHNLESHVKEYDLLIKKLEEKIEKKKLNREPGTNFLCGIKNNVEDMRKHLLSFSKAKRIRSQASPVNRVPGLKMPCSLSKDLSSFLNVEENTKLSRTEVYTAIYAYINIKEGETREKVLKFKYLNEKGRNLQKKIGTKTIIEPDKKLSKLLNYEKYVSDVESGKILKTTFDKITGEEKEIVITDSNLTYRNILSLIEVHLKTFKE